MMQHWRILIVDDERPARDKLRRLITQHAHASLISEARDGVEALNLLSQERYDVIFLDIHMPELDGLSVAQRLPLPMPQIVFVTAYDQFALRAFDANAIDYLLKPYDEERFLRALSKVGNALRALQVNANVELELAPLIIQDRGHVLVLPIPDIHWVEAADNYVILHTATGNHILRQTLTVTLQRLGSAYRRCHRSYLVRLDQIIQFDTKPNGKGDGALVLQSKALIPCSRQFRDVVLESLGAKT